MTTFYLIVSRKSNQVFSGVITLKDGADTRREESSSDSIYYEQREGNNKSLMTHTHTHKQTNTHKQTHFDHFDPDWVLPLLWPLTQSWISTVKVSLQQPAKCFWNLPDALRETQLGMQSEIGLTFPHSRCFSLNHGPGLSPLCRQAHIIIHHKCHVAPKIHSYPPKFRKNNNHRC